MARRGMRKYLAGAALAIGIVLAVLWIASTVPEATLYQILRSRTAVLALIFGVASFLFFMVGFALRDAFERRARGRQERRGKEPERMGDI